MLRRNPSVLVRPPMMMMRGIQRWLFRSSAQGDVKSDDRFGGIIHVHGLAELRVKQRLQQRPERLTGYAL